MANRYATQNFSVTVAGPPVHDDYVWEGALRDSASQTVTGTPASFWTVTAPDPLTPLGAYMAYRPAGP